jgi:valyl-tRNA synthetase
MPKGMLLQQQKDNEADITKFKAEFGTDAYAQIDQLHRRLIQSCERDPDVLDTWFSSALWPFSTLGWPEQTEELKTYYPGDVLCTAREIITLWVSRMVMMGQYCADNIPFKDVYIHAMIQDGLGRKMSKSLGNGIDPLAVIDSHGTDAMRFTLASMTTDTQDVRMPVEMLKLPDGREVNTSPKFDVGRNFCNKIWNASRFAMMNLEGVEPAKFDAGKLSLDDKWILSKLARTVKEVTEAIEAFKFNEPMSAIYKFFWNDLCDWYLEWIKPRMRDEDQRHIAQNVLAYVFDSVLRLMHPFMPFISEAIFAELRQLVPTINLKGIDEAVPADALVIAKWPATPASLIDEQTEKQIDVVQAVIRSIRDIRSQYNVSPAVKLNAMAAGPETACKMLNHNAGMLCKLANLESFTAGVGLEKPARAAAAIANDLNVYVDNVIDPEAERKRLEKLKEQITNQLKGMEAKLNNENYLSKAKPEIVQETRNKAAELKEQLETIEKHIASI